MRKILFILLVLLVSVLLVAGIGTPNPSGAGLRYVSMWTEVPAGQTVNFSHVLGVKPLELNVWEAPFVNGVGSCQVNFTAVIPAYEGAEIEVRLVTTEYVSIFNHADVSHCIQVVARP